MKRIYLLIAFFIIICPVFSLDKVSVFHPSDTRAGLLRNDSILAEGIYNKIGIHNSQGGFEADRQSPFGYYEVAFGTGNVWNIIDTEGNTFFEENSNTPYQPFSKYLIKKNSDKSAILLNLRGETLMSARTMQPVGYKWPFGDELGLWVVTDSVSPKTIFYDINLIPLAELDGKYEFTVQDGVIYASKYEDMKKVDLVTLNSDGVIGKQYGARAYPVNLKEVVKKNDYNSLQELYLKVPPLIIKQTDDKNLSVFFLDSLLRENVPLKNTYEKSVAKVWKDIAPTIMSTESKDYFTSHYYQKAINAVDHNKKETLASGEKLVSPVNVIEEKDGKKFFSRNGRPSNLNPNLYLDIDTITGTQDYIAYSDSTCSLVDKNGIIIRKNCKAIERLPIVGKYDSPALMITTGEGKCIIRTDGINYSKIYEDIITVKNPKGDILGFFFIKDGRWGYACVNKVHDPEFYDYIEEFNDTGLAKVYCNGFSGVIDYSGKKKVKICEELYRSGVDKRNSPEERIACLKTVTDLAAKANESEYLQPSYHTMGEIFEEANCLDEAQNAFEWAEICGMESAKNDVRRIKMKKLDNTLQQISSALTNIASVLGGNTSGISSNITSFDPSMTGGGGSSAQGQYRNWERRAKSIYESLTYSGYTKKKDGKAQRGGAMGSKTPGNFLAQKRLLREAQNEMRRIRRENPSIMQSEYENVDVVF